MSESNSKSNTAVSSEQDVSAASRTGRGASRLRSTGGACWSSWPSA
jgi:hypothetical protein